MPWTVQENTFSIETYFEIKSFIAVQSHLRGKCQCRFYPEKNSFIGGFRNSHVRVIDYLAHRFQLCLQGSGSHLEHIFERV
jgi:hypothetical protein